jgi:hypothetical protein
MPRPASMQAERIKHEPGAVASPWLTIENGGPVAAPLPDIAEILEQPLACVVQAAERVEPYTRADGAAVWSIRLVGIQLGVRRSRRERERKRSRRRRAARLEAEEAAS